MKKYFNAILISAILLLLFPFLGFPELWENIYVSVLAFVVGYSSMLLRHKTTLAHDLEEESSLEEYIKELKDRFQTEMPKPEKKSNRISDIQIDDKK